MVDRLEDALRALDYRGGEDEAPAPRSALLPAIDLADVARWDGVVPPEIPFVIPQWLPRGCTSVIGGAGGVGKTMKEQLLLTSVAAGLRCLGQQPVHAAAAGIFAEDPEIVLHNRQARINRKLGIDYDRLEGRLFIRSYAGLNALLWKDERPTTFLAELEESLARIPDLALVTLDNAALLYGGNENDRNETTAFVNVLNGMAARLNVSILLSAHTSKTSDQQSHNFISGSTAWVNASRSGMLLAAGTVEDPPMLKLLKSNYARLTEIQLAWEDGVLVTHEESTGIVATIEKRSRDNLVLDAIREATASQPLSEHNTRPNYVAKVLLTLGQCRGMSKRDIEQAVIRLRGAKLIEVREYGRNSQRHPVMSVMATATATPDREG